MELIFADPKVFNFTRQELLNYDRTKMAEQDKRGSMEYAVQQAELKGLEKGRQEGLEEGIEKGKIAASRSLPEEGLLTQKLFDAKVAAMKKNP